MSGPWEEMDEWCKKQASAVSAEYEKKFAEGEDTSSPAMRDLFGQSIAFHRMRSYTHGARNA